MELSFCTTNSQKFHKGQAVCAKHGIVLSQKPLDIDEIQSHDVQYVARKKAEAAYQHNQKPILISDDAWEITALRGFPGTYAKDVNQWFSPDDYVRLTHDLEDKEIFLIQTLVYQDNEGQQLFIRKNRGSLLPEPRGKTGISIQKVVAFDDDNGKSISEVLGDNTFYPGSQAQQVWDDFCKWYMEHKT